MRAIEGGWIFHAELAARECGNLTLAKALEPVCLYTEAVPAKFERAALRWPARYLTEASPSLLRAPDRPGRPQRVTNWLRCGETSAA
jgi:hypothetical protein